MNFDYGKVNFNDNWKFHLGDAPEIANIDYEERIAYSDTTT